MQSFNYISNTFSYYNQELFQNKLPEVVITISRDHKLSGMFQADKWKSKDGQMIHELTVNPDYIEPYDIEFHQTIVHEMCHLYQHLFGNPGRSGYHNLEFSDIMKNVGLQTSDTGTPDGFKTGRRMYDFVIDNGPFEKAFQKLQENRFDKLEIQAVKNKIKPSSGLSGKRSKYTCICGLNVWGKAGLEIVCKKCVVVFWENK